MHGNSPMLDAHAEHPGSLAALSFQGDTLAYALSPSPSQGLSQAESAFEEEKLPVAPQVQPVNEPVHQGVRVERMYIPPFYSSAGIDVPEGTKCPVPFTYLAKCVDRAAAKVTEKVVKKHHGICDL